MISLSVLDQHKISAQECARYIFDSDCEQISYQEFVQDSNDPRDHILYHAAVVLEQTEDFQKDITEYDKTSNHNS